MAILKWACQWRVSILLYIPTGDEELLSKYIKIKVHLTSVLSVFFCEVWKMVAHTEGRTFIEGVWEQDDEEIIWT